MNNIYFSESRRKLGNKSFRNIIFSWNISGLSIIKRQIDASCWKARLYTVFWQRQIVSLASSWFTRVWTVWIVAIYIGASFIALLDAFLNLANPSLDKHSFLMESCHVHNEAGYITKLPAAAYVWQTHTNSGYSILTSSLI